MVLLQNAISTWTRGKLIAFSWCSQLLKDGLLEEGQEY